MPPNVEKCLLTSTCSPAEPWPPAERYLAVGYLGRLVEEEYSISLLLSILFWLKNISYLFLHETLSESEKDRKRQSEKKTERGDKCHQIIYIFFKTFFNHKLISEREACPETSRLSVHIYRKFASTPSLGWTSSNPWSTYLNTGKGAELCVNVLKTRQSDWSVSTPKQTIGWQFVCVLLSATLLKNNSLVDVTRNLWPLWRWERDSWL